MEVPLHSSPESLKFQAVGEIQIDRKGGETTATQKITYNGHEYEVEVKLKGTGHSDSEMKTHMQESLEKTKLFAKSLGLGTEVSAFSFGGDQTFSAHNMQGTQMTNEQLKNKLEEAKTKYEDKQVLFKETRETKRKGKLTADSPEFQNKAAKLESKIKTLSQLTAILGKQSREDDVEIGIHLTHSSPPIPTAGPPNRPPPPLLHPNFPSQAKSSNESTLAETPKSPPQTEQTSKTMQTETTKPSRTKDEIQADIKNKEAESKKITDDQANLNKLYNEANNGDTEEDANNAKNLLGQIKDKQNEFLEKNYEIGRLHEELRSLPKEEPKASLQPPPTLLTPGYNMPPKNENNVETP